MDFETYIEIPDWVEEFDLEVKTVGPIEVGIWEEPDHIITKNNRIIGEESTEDVKLVIRFGGVPEEIGTGSYNVTIVDTNSDTVIHEMTLHTLE